MSETPVATHGRDLEKVGVALTGAAAIMEVTEDFTPPTVTEFAEEEYALPVGFRGLGLRKTDGAPEWADEADGDALEFFEDGFTIPSGLVTVTCTMTLAQTSPLVIELKSGIDITANSGGDLDLGGNAKRYVLYTEEVYRTAGGGTLIERRMAEVTVQSVSHQRPERGEVRGHEVVFAAGRSTLFGGTHMRYALVPVAAA